MSGFRKNISPMNNQLLNFLTVGAGSAVGAMMRYGLSMLLVGQPLIATMAANVAGSFLIGLAMATARGRVLLFLTVGLCGGFTTFSTFSAQTLGLIQGGNYQSALGYALLSVILCLGATYSALRLT